MRLLTRIWNRFRPSCGEGAVDDGGDFRLIDDVQLAVTDDVDVRLIELPEPAPLCSFASIDLANLIAAEGKLQFAIVERHILGQGNGQVKAESQVAVTLLETVDLLLCLPAAFGQQDFGRFNDGGVQGGEAVEGIGIAQDLHDALHLLLGDRQ